MNRRKFFRLSALGSLGVMAASTVFSTACFISGSVFNQILAYVGLGLRAFQSILDILSGAGVIPAGGAGAIDAVVNLVKSGFADLQIAVENYQNAPADQKNTLLQKVSTVLAVLEANLQQFWADLNIPDQALGTLIKGLLGIILATLGGFATQLPAPQSTPQIEKAKKLKNIIMVPAQKRTPKQFKNDFNAKLQQAGGDYTKYQVK